MAPPAKDAPSFARLPVGLKLLLLVLLLGVISAIYYFALHMPLADEIDAAQRTYTQLRGQLREAEQRQQEYLRLSQELASREAIDRQYKRVLPEQAEIAAFLQDLNRLAELSGLDINLVEPRPEQVEELYTRVPVALSISGRFHQIARFFYNVSRLERAINMDNVQLMEPVVRGDEVVLSANVLATTFRRPSARAEGDDDEAAAGAGGKQAKKNKKNKNKAKTKQAKKQR